jgi:hypothetical protein
MGPCHLQLFQARHSAPLRWQGAVDAGVIGRPAAGRSRLRNVSDSLQSLPVTDWPQDHAGSCRILQDHAGSCRIMQSPEPDG